MSFGASATAAIFRLARGALMVTAALGPLGHAGPLETSTAQALSRASAAARTGADQTTQKAFGAASASAQRARQRTQKAFDDIAGFSAPEVPRIDVKGLAGTDVGAIAKKYAQITRGPHATQPVPLLVFISFSMPMPSLHALVKEARKTGAVLLLRGLVHNSLRPTLLAVHRLIGDNKRPVTIQIDPRQFRRYHVKVVPTFALTFPPGPNARTCRVQPKACDHFTPDHVRVSGDVTMRYALQYMSRQDPRAAPLAEPLLAKLERDEP